MRAGQNFQFMPAKRPPCIHHIRIGPQIYNAKFKIYLKGIGLQNISPHSISCCSQYSISTVSTVLVCCCCSPHSICMLLLQFVQYLSSTVMFLQSVYRVSILLYCMSMSLLQLLLTIEDYHVVAAVCTVLLSMLLLCLNSIIMLLRQSAYYQYAAVAVRILIVFERPKAAH